MRSVLLSAAGAWQAAAISAALIIGGLSLVGVGSPPPWWTVHVALSAITLGVLISFAAGFARVHAYSRRRSALRILDQLVAAGDRAVQVRRPQSPDALDEIAVNEWRNLVGILMTTPPFRPGLSDTVLGGQDTNWISDELRRLREMALRFDDDWLA